MRLPHLQRQYQRRDLLIGTLVGALAVSESFRSAKAIQPTQEELRAKAHNWKESAIEAFPFELIEVNGEQALTLWTELRQKRDGYPVVLGNADTLAELAAPFVSRQPSKTAERIISIADGLRHPEDLRAKRALDYQAAMEFIRKSIKNSGVEALPEIIIVQPDGTPRTLTREETIAEYLRKPQPPPEGKWPAEAPPMPSLSVAQNYKGQFEKVYITIIPTDDPTTVPAYLQWGGWNACPAPEYHIAALRSWRDRYGAELVGLNLDTMNVRAKRRPQTREEAIELAREQYVYCNDIIDQGVGTVSELAAALKANDWWYFWWD